MNSERVPTPDLLAGLWNRMRVGEQGAKHTCYPEFFRWYEAELAEAEKRGAVRALRDVEETLGWLGAQGNIPDGTTPWHGISECRRIIRDTADRMEAGDE